MSITINAADWSKCRRANGQFVNLRDPKQTQGCIGLEVKGLHPQLVPSKPGYFKISSAGGRPCCDFMRGADGIVRISDNIYL